MSQYRRTNFKPEAAFQYRMSLRIARLMGACLVVALISSGLGAVAFAQLTGERELLENIAAQPLLAVLCWILPAFAALLVCFLATMRHSFSLAGPLHRYRIVFRQIQDGELPAGVGSRKGDELRDLTAELSGAVEHLHASFEQLGRCAEELSARLEAQSVRDAEVQRLVTRLRVLAGQWDAVAPIHDEDSLAA